jgi:hypothetical protein
VSVGDSSLLFEDIYSKVLMNWPVGDYGGKKTQFGVNMGGRWEAGHEGVGHLCHLTPDGDTSAAGQGTKALIGIVGLLGPK